MAITHQADGPNEIWSWDITWLPGPERKAATFLDKLYDLGITSSHSRPRVSNDNAYSESLFKTLKFRPGFPANGFETIEAARRWVLAFVRWYNEEHRHSMPALRHTRATP